MVEAFHGIDNDFGDGFNAKNVNFINSAMRSLSTTTNFTLYATHSLPAGKLVMLKLNQSSDKSAESRKSRTENLQLFFSFCCAVVSLSGVNLKADENSNKV